MKETRVLRSSDGASAALRVGFCSAFSERGIGRLVLGMSLIACFIYFRQLEEEASAIVCVGVRACVPRA